MAHWLMKTEPQDYSWERLLADGETEWTGVRNHQAAGNMRAMKRGERVFFYRSQVGPAIVGVMEVSAEAYPEPEDPTGKFVRVKVKPVRAVKKEVSLKEIKGDPRFADFLLVRHSRLSVVPVSDEHWRSLCEMAGVQEGGSEG
jgi:predicted RNA-binding protein with PUA-like domain